MQFKPAPAIFYGLEGGLLGVCANFYIDCKYSYVRKKAILRSHPASQPRYREALRRDWHLHNEVFHPDGDGWEGSAKLVSVDGSQGSHFVLL